MTDRQVIAEGAKREPHRRTRLPVIATVVVIVAVGALVGWTTAKYFTGRIAETEAVDVKLPASGNAARSSPSPVPAAKKREDDTAKVSEPRREPSRIGVDSYPLSAGYALDEWSAGTGNSGYLDEASVNGQTLTGKGAALLADGDVVELFGWAGDASLGLRYPFVLISACGKVVAHVAVGLPRSDVAAAVHPNLGKSG